MQPPLIGIVASRQKMKNGTTRIYLPEDYVQSVLHAGGLPVIIPLGLPAAALAEIAAQLDGVLYSGGGDMSPDRYGGSGHPKVSSVDPDRDQVELDLFQDIYRTRLPFLGICRGFQVINVALGGTLYEDVLAMHPGAQRHQFSKDFPRNHLAHSVQVSEGTRTAEILGQPIIEVNSMHHQGVRRLADGLQATAFAPDGLIEAFEMPGYPFGMAVQWHPECLQEHAAMRRIFESFVRAAGDSA
jgi:putative glutamine amidotransferase